MVGLGFNLGVLNPEPLLLTRALMPLMEILWEAQSVVYISARVFS